MAALTAAPYLRSARNGDAGSTGKSPRLGLCQTASSYSADVYRAVATSACDQAPSIKRQAPVAFALRKIAGSLGSRTLS
jgi:hypothetical protein